MDLEDIRRFLAVADEGHFGNAAARLGISQPALSQAVRRLEADLGVELFTRTTRTVALTSAGAALAERGDRLLEEARATVTHLRRLARGEVGHLRIGYVGSTLYGTVPRVVSRLRAASPDAELELVERKTAEQVTALLGGAQDVGFVHLPEAGLPGLAVRELAVEDIRLAVPAAWFDDGRRAVVDPARPLPLARFADRPFVLFPRRLEPDTHDLLMRTCARAGFAPQIAQEATGLHTLLGLVAAGVGAAFVTEQVALGAATVGAAFVPLQEPPSLTTALAWREPVTNPLVALLARIVLPGGLDADEMTRST